MLTQKEFYDDNVRATASLIEFIKELDLKNVIHYSTVSVYGHNNILKDEIAELKPNNAYGLTKLKSEELLLVQDIQAQN